MERGDAHALIPRALLARCPTVSGKNDAWYAEHSPRDDPKNTYFRTIEVEHCRALVLDEGKKFCKKLPIALIYIACAKV